MITVLLEYPNNLEVYSYKLPLPANVGNNQLTMLTFFDDGHYCSYVNTICDIIDDLEHSRFFSHKEANVDKLRVCKVLLKRLIDIKLSLN